MPIYYIDYDAVSDGDGSSTSPWNNHASAEAGMVDGDVCLVKGILPDLMNFTFSKAVTYKAWGTIPPTIYETDMTMNSSLSDKELIFDGFNLLKQTYENNSTKFINNNSAPEVTTVFRNCVVQFNTHQGYGAVAIRGNVTYNVHFENCGIIHSNGHAIQGSMSGEVRFSKCYYLNRETTITGLAGSGSPASNYHLIFEYSVLHDAMGALQRHNSALLLQSSNATGSGTTTVKANIYYGMNTTDFGTPTVPELLRSDTGNYDPRPCKPIPEIPDETIRLWHFDPDPVVADGTRNARLGLAQTV